MDWQAIYKSKLVSVEEAAGKIKSGDTIWFSPCASGPIGMINAISARREELKGCHALSGLAMHPYPFMKPEFKGHIDYHCFFMGPLERKFRPMGNVDVTSIHFSRLDMFVKNFRPNVAVLSVSPPDEQGYMSYGVLGTAVNQVAVDMAKMVIVQVNKHEPYVYGEKHAIHVSKVDYICEFDSPIPELPDIPNTDLEKAIAAPIIDMIPDGACLQIGLGGIANAVGYGLESKKDLGIHTEMLTSSMEYLVRKGAVTCSRKNHYPGKIIAGFGIGTRALYDMMHRNPLVYVAPIYEVNAIDNIAANDNFVSINNALMVDITGQVCSEAIGFSQFSCTGGQLDFVRAAAQSKGGKSFIALSSTVETKDGPESRICLKLPPGTAVTTPRADVMYVVTEYGVADIYNKSIDTRAKELIKIAHPDFRDELAKQAREVGLFV